MQSSFTCRIFVCMLSVNRLSCFLQWLCALCDLWTDLSTEFCMAASCRSVQLVELHIPAEVVSIAAQSGRIIRHTATSEYYCTTRPTTCWAARGWHWCTGLLHARHSTCSHGLGTPCGRREQIIQLNSTGNDGVAWSCWPCIDGHDRHNDSYATAVGCTWCWCSAAQQACQVCTGSGCVVWQGWTSGELALVVVLYHWHSSSHRQILKLEVSQLIATTVLISFFKVCRPVLPVHNLFI